MSYTSTITASVISSGDDLTVQELILSGLILPSAGSSACSYTLAAGQERDVLANILPLTAPLSCKYYAIKSNALISIGTSLTVGTAVTYAQPAGTFFLWVGALTPQSLAGLKIKAASTATAPVNVTVLIGFD